MGSHTYLFYAAISLLLKHFFNPIKENSVSHEKFWTDKKIYKSLCLMKHDKMAKAQCNYDSY